MPTHAWNRSRAALVALIAAVAMLVALSACQKSEVTDVTGIAAGEVGEGPFSADFGADVKGLTAAVSTEKLRGDTPGLFGGTRNASVCDKAKLVEFLLTNAVPATRWVKVLKLADRAAIPEYVRKLTPVVLRVDTLVRNHTMDTSFDAILQAGTAVLVDEFGIPVVKCNCGNPLTRTDKDAGRIRLKTPDATWKNKGSKPTRIDKPKTKVPKFHIADLQAPDSGINRTPGTDGEQDEAAEAPAPLPDRSDDNALSPSGSGTGTTTDSPSGTPTSTGDEGTPTGTGTVDGTRTATETGPPTGTRTSTATATATDDGTSDSTDYSTDGTDGTDGTSERTSTATKPMTVTKPAGATTRPRVTGSP
ncbi:DUF6777 domain-containing protein [Yinghuangia sp. YIM S10712]|uniref:DUF6777 domain-containing protein n=1 Tax=Yinghuangia sp. YIM S10712 TaxID=3436930 RepID=UPI003F529229